MLLRLNRSAPQGLAVRGKLYIVTYNMLEEREIETLICPTLEHRDYLILPLYYRLTVTYSPRFKRPLPLVNDVPQSPPVPLKGEEKHPEERFRLRVLDEETKNRGGFEAPSASCATSEFRGCILVPDRAAEDRLRELILSEKETWIEINNP